MDSNSTLTVYAKSNGRWKIAVGLIILVVAILAAALLTSQRDKSSGSLPRIAYAMPITLAAIPAYIASEKGFWKNEGLDVD